MNIFISASIKQRRDAFDVLLRQRNSAAHHRIDEAFVRHEALQRTEHSVFRYRIPVLVRIWHARIEGEIAVAIRIRPDVIADLSDPLMRRAHESPDPFFVRCIEYIDDGARVLKAHCLSARLLLGHVIDAKELVVAEQKAIHNHLRAQGVSKRGRFARAAEERIAGTGALPWILQAMRPLFSRRDPLAASAIIISIERSVTKASRNELMFCDAR